MSSYQEYSNIEISTEVLSATGHRQIQLLIEKCLQHVNAARLFIVDKNTPKKHDSISKALDILTYLRSILNFKDPQAAELSTLLGTIYASAEKNLAMANLKNDASYLDPVMTALTEVKTGWDGIA